MPRAKKQAPNVAYNERPQPVAAPTGMPYGENQAMRSAQAAVPIPSARPVTAALGGMPPEQAQQADTAAQLEATQAYNPTPIGLLNQTTRPNEPVTTGLASGPGAGPGILSMPQSSLAQTYYTLAQATGDDTFYDLAEQAMRSGQ